MNILAFLPVALFAASILYAVPFAISGECIIKHPDGKYSQKCHVSDKASCDNLAMSGDEVWFYDRDCDELVNPGTPIGNFDAKRTSFFISAKPSGETHNCTSGRYFAKLGEWIPFEILIDTSEDDGYCELAFGIYDPENLIASTGAGLTVHFYHGGAPTRECRNLGTRIVPIYPLMTTDANSLPITWPPFIDDTDDSKEGVEWCNLAFQVTGNDSIELDIEYHPNGGVPIECMTAAATQQKPAVASFNNMITIGLNTRGGPGGCQINFRLRKK
jgi:hypothetical protein